MAMPLQQIFTTAATHLLTQNSRSGKDGSCFYRHHDGRKCAVGALIPDAFYLPEMDNVTASSDTSVFAKLTLQVLRNADIIDDDDFDDAANYRRDTDKVRILLLSELQSVHDSRHPADWRMYLEDIANAYTLEMPA